MSRKQDSLLNQLRWMVSPLGVEASDRTLLEKFLESRDESAFAALLGRHGPMVYAVSRRLLGQIHDAEDVTQATFLLLARKAGRIRKRTSVGPWLHGVAHRLSIQLKRRDMNRRKRETQVAGGREESREPNAHGAEAQDLLHAALRDLPEAFRAVIILCCLEGRSQQEAARQLSCAVGTIQSRLARGRKLLQERLAARGVVLSTSGVTTLLAAQIASAALPAKLFGATLRAAVGYSSGKVLTELVSAPVALLVKEGLGTLSVAKAVWIAVGVLSLGLLAGGVGFVGISAQTAGEEVQTAIQEQKPRIAKTKDSEDSPRVDAMGDPLPPLALARLGTTRFRHGGNVHNLAFTDDEKKILAADGYGVYLWDAASGKLLKRFGDHLNEHSLSHASFATNGLMALAPRQASVAIIDSATGKVLRNVASDRFPTVVLSPDGKSLALLEGAKEDHIIHLLDVESGAERHNLSGHQDRIQSILFSADSKTLVTSSDDKSIRFWSVATGEQTAKLNHDALVGTIALAPDGKTLASVDLTKTENKKANAATIFWTPKTQVLIWDLAARKVSRRLDHQKSSKGPGLPHRVYGLLFSPDSKTLVTSDTYGVHFWDLASVKETPERTLVSKWGMAMAFTRDGATLATGGEAIRLWDTATGKEKLPMGHSSWVYGVAISPDSNLIATGGGDNHVRFWDMSSAKEIRQFAGTGGVGVGSVVFAQGIRFVLTSSFQDSIKVWDFAAGRELYRLPYSTTAVSPDGKLLLVAPDKSANNTKTKEVVFYIHELATGKEIHRWTLDQPWYGLAAFSWDTKFVYTWDRDKIVRVRDIATGKELRHFEGNALWAKLATEEFNRIFRHAFSPDGKLVALGNQSGQIAVFDIATGEELRSFTSKFGSLSSLAISHDNRFVATGHWTDKDAHLCEIATGQEFMQFSGHNGRILCLAFSADGKVLLSGNTDTTALAWDLTGTRTSQKSPAFAQKGLDSAWSDLSSADAARGQKAVRAFLAVPDQALGLFARNLQPARSPDEKMLARTIAELDSDQLKTREDAMRELERIGDVAEPGIRKALDGTPPLELKRRLEGVLEKYSSFHRLRTLRAVQALEYLGTQAAREQLARLAEGSPEALLTREAQAAAERLDKVRAATR